MCDFLSKIHVIMSGGFKRQYQVRATLSGSGTKLWVNPSSWSVVPESLGSFDSEDVFTAGSAGMGAVTANFEDGNGVGGSVNVDAGEMKYLDILDENGDEINDIFVVGLRQTYQFQCVGVDIHGNYIPINSDWLTINESGLIGALTREGPENGRLNTNYSLSNSYGKIVAFYEDMYTYKDILIDPVPKIKGTINYIDYYGSSNSVVNIIIEDNSFTDSYNIEYKINNGSSNLIENCRGNLITHIGTDKKYVTIPIENLSIGDTVNFRISSIIQDKYGSSDKCVPCFVNGINPEFEELHIPETVCLTLHCFYLIVYTLQRSC